MGMVMGLLGGGGGGGISGKAESTAKTGDNKQTVGNTSFGNVSVNNSKSNPWPWVIGIGAGLLGLAGVAFAFLRKRT